MRYEFKPSARVPLSVDPQAVGERLASLRDVWGEGFTPHIVVEDAKDPNSPLHPAFEWDVQRAAEAHWLSQAQRLVAAVVVIERIDTPPVRAFVSVHEQESHERRYIVRTVALSDAEYRAQIIERALAEERSWLARYREFPELAGLVAAIDKAMTPKRRRRAA